MKQTNKMQINQNNRQNARPSGTATRKKHDEAQKISLIESGVRSEKGGNSSTRDQAIESRTRRRRISIGKILFNILRVVFMLVGMSVMVLFAIFIYSKLSSMADLDKQLLIAAEMGDIQQAASLIDQGAKLEAHLAEYQGRTALHLAAMHGHEALVKWLLAKGADPKARSMEWQTPLHGAANQRCKVAIVRALIGAGANVGERDLKGRTVLDQRTSEACKRVLHEYRHTNFRANNE